MVNIDLKDRKILYELDLNCRQSNAQIGKKVGLSKEVATYRIKRMEEEGIITGYWTQIDSYRFGYQVYRYYLVLQNATPAIKENIVQTLIHYKNMWVVAAIKGFYDLSVVVWVKSIPEFYQFWDEFNEKYGDYLAEKIFSVYLQADTYPLSYLLGNEYLKSDREKPQMVGGREPVKIDGVDYQILNIISENGRVSIIKLAEELDCSSQTVNYRMKSLEKKDIIQGYHVGVDVSSLGLQEFKVDIWLNELSKRRKIWDYIKYNPHVTFINTSAGYADIEIEFTIENIDTLVEVIEDLSSKFPGAIKKYVHWSAKKGYKLRCLPEMTKADFKF